MRKTKALANAVVLPLQISLLAIAACSSDGAAPIGWPGADNFAEPTAGSALSPDAGPVAPPAAIGRAVRLATPVRELSAQLAARAEAWAPLDAGAFVSAGWRAAERGVFDRVGARIPAHARDPFEVGLGQTERFRLRLVARGASDAHVAVHDGRALYADAYPSTDLVVTSTDNRFEELIVLRDEGAPRSFDYTVDLPAGLPEVRFEDSGGLSFADIKGNAVLAMPPAYAVDAAGVRRDATLAWEAGNLSVRLDVEGLSFPILLDPAIESVVWQQVAATGAGSRMENVMAFDSARNVSVVFGGHRGSVPPFLRETWEWNGSAWTQKCTTMPCNADINMPSARAYAGAAFDSFRSKTVLFGGEDLTGFQSDTWEWSGTAWVPRCATGACGPGTRRLPGMAYDSARKKTVLFGGDKSAGGQWNDTWEWDGTSWAPACQSVQCSMGAPSARSYVQMAYDAARGVVVMFGGIDSKIADYSDETWEYNGTLWTQVCNMPPCNMKVPTPRIYHSLAYDSIRHKTVLFGGYPVNFETWEWDGTAWSELSPGSYPTVREAAMAFDSTRGRVVLHGGWLGASVSAATWEYHARGGGCSTVGQCDTGICVDGVCCETDCNQACERCDAAPTPGICSSVISADDADHCPAATSTCDASGVCKKKPGQGCSTGTDCASGYCFDMICCSSDCTGGCNVCNATPGTCTVVGQGNAGANPGCGAYVCDGSTGTCPTGCADDNGCAATYYCASNRTCQLRVAQAAACDPSDCLVAGCRECAGTATCKDGYCCDTACTGACKTCAGSSPGTCSTVASADDADTCNGANTCDAAGACKKKNGQSCVMGTECALANCVESTCCNTSCTGGCDVCTTGTCTPVAQGSPGATPTCAPYLCDGVSGNCPGGCASDAACATGSYCAANGTCQPQKAMGTMCSDSAGQDCKVGACRVCATGYCVDGVCCDTPCAGTCQACSAAKKLQGADGTCGNVLADSDPDSNCADPAPNSCGPDGKCDGNGACRPYAKSGSVCGANTCAAGLQSGLQCNGAGSCLQANNTPCAPFKCNAGATACNTSCDSDNDCTVDGFCNAAHVCKPKQANGLTCAAGRECTSGFCADGMCCNSACTAQCEACDVPPNAGTCSPVKGVPHAGKSACTGSETCGGACDGTNAAACSYPGTTTSCGATCASGALTESACDGKGACMAAAPKPCAPYVCDGATKCKSTCAADADCATGYACATDHSCAPAGSTCTDDHTQKNADGKVTDCTPYRCQGKECAKACTSVDDCLAPNVCDGLHTCVPPATDTAQQDSGCGCRVPGRASPTSSGSAIAALGLALCATRRLRRRSGRGAKGTSP